MTYAIITAGVVANIIVADPSFVELYYPTAVAIDGLAPMPGVGWAVSGGLFMKAPSFAASRGVPISPCGTPVVGGSGAGYTFTATGLPSGLSMADTGEISGTSSANPSAYQYSATVTDSLGNHVTDTATITLS